MDSLFFAYISRIFWVLGMIVSGINTVILKFRLRPQIQKNPDLAIGYSQLLLGYWLRAISF